MDNPTALKERIKTMLVENLMLQLTATDIADDLPLFGPGRSSICAPCPDSQALSSTIAMTGSGPNRRVSSTTLPTWSECP